MRAKRLFHGFHEFSLKLQIIGKTLGKKMFYVVSNFFFYKSIHILQNNHKTDEKQRLPAFLSHDAKTCENKACVQSMHIMHNKDKMCEKMFCRSFHREVRNACKTTVSCVLCVLL